MNEINGGEPNDATAGQADVLWTTYRHDDLIHAVADVPQSIPKHELGFGASNTAATVFVGSPNGPNWPVDLPEAVNPTPTSVSYNNGVFEVVFTLETDDHPAEIVG